MKSLFRVCRAIHAPLDGEGARRAGGRWNSPGRPVVYMAESVALAVLENLVHMSRQDFPAGYVVVSAIVPDDVKILSLGDIQSQRSETPQHLEDMWLEVGESAILRVPSVIVPSEFNYLLNPRHPDFVRIVASVPSPFAFDERLFGPI